MKKTFCCLATLAATSVFAEPTVNIYGNLDQGIYREKDSGVTQSKISSSAGSTSTLGFRGSEDLGNGTSAYFNLLSELDLPGGQIGSNVFGNAATNGGQKSDIFTRMAKVGLKDNTYGSFEIGRLQDAVWLTQTALNNTNLNSFGWSAYTSAMNNTGATTNDLTKAGTLASFTGINPTDRTFSGTTTAGASLGTANSAYTGSGGIGAEAGWSYISPVLFNSVTVTYQKIGANFGNDTSATPTAAGQSIRLQYENGPWNVQVASTTRNGSDGNTAWRSSVYGVTYKWQAFKFVVGQATDRFQGTLSNLDHITVNGFGVLYTASDRVDLAMAYTTMKDDTNSANKSEVTALTARYNFSKSTLAYVGLGHEVNSGVNNRMSMYLGPIINTAAGAGSTGYLIGIRHRFQ